MTLDADAIDAVARRVADVLEERGLALAVKGGQDNGLATPTQLAAEKGVTRRTVHNRINEWGLVRRDKEGFPKEHEGGATYISRPAWRAREGLPTQTVRRLAGYHD